MKDNKLLIEFVGYKYKILNNPPQIVITDDKFLDYEPDSLFWDPSKFKNWWQLMMVVEKIEKTNAEMQITTDLILIIDDFGNESIYPVRNYKTKIEAVYNACVEYIKSK